MSEAAAYWAAAVADDALCYNKILNPFNLQNIASLAFVHHGLPYRIDR